MQNNNWDQVSIESILTGVPLGWVRFLSSTASTNDVAAQMAGEGAPDLSLVIAGEQTAGKGRAGRKWFSPPDAAIAISLVLRIPSDTTWCSDSNHLLLRHTALGALAVYDALQALYQLMPEIKWPNDVLLNERKTCGVLAETLWLGNQLESILLGIGLNIYPQAIPPESELLFPATCVQDHVRQEVNRLELLRLIVEKILFWRSRIESSSFIQAWEARLAFRQQWVSIVNETGSASMPVILGKVNGLDTQGRLLLKDQHGQTLTIQFGELRLRPV